MGKRVDSWVVTDALWQRVEPLVPQRALVAGKQYVRKPGAGRPAKPARLVFEAIVYVLRTGCQWKALPVERFGSASAVHKRFLEWEKAGFFESVWRAGLAEYDDMQGIAWRWQSIDGAMMKAPLAQEAVGRNPTDRGKRMDCTCSGGVAICCGVFACTGGRAGTTCGAVFTASGSGAITGALACAAGASVPSAHHQTPSATSNTATPKSACQGRRALGLARSRPGGSASWLLSPGTRPRSRSASARWSASSM